MENETFLKRALLGSVVMATVANLGVHAASASIINSSRSAFDVSGTLTVAGFLPVSLTLNPVATAMGSGAASYSNGGIASAGLNQSLSVLGIRSANLTSSPNTATASFDASSSKANASATGINVNLNFLGSGNSDVLSLAVPSFTSTATVSVTTARLRPMVAHLSHQTRSCRLLVRISLWLLSRPPTRLFRVRWLV